MSMPKNTPEDFWSKVDIKSESECWEWKGSKLDGYGRFCIEGSYVLAHRYSWMMNNKMAISEGRLILHKCDNRSCVNPNHLYCGTPKDNMKDKGDRTPYIPEIYGSWKSVLYEGEVWLIRRLRAGSDHIKLSQDTIAKMLKVSQATISKVCGSNKYLCKENYYV